MFDDLTSFSILIAFAVMGIVLTILDCGSNSVRLFPNFFFPGTSLSPRFFYRLILLMMLSFAFAFFATSLTNFVFAVIETLLDVVFAIFETVITAVFSVIKLGFDILNFLLSIL
jgi:hypothetical protein